MSVDQILLPKNRKDWIAQLAESDTSIVNETAIRIMRITDDDSSNCAELEAVIVGDAGLSGQIIKVANSAAKNTTEHGTPNIHHAILQLGFVEIKEIALSVCIFRRYQQKAVSGRHARALAESLLLAVLGKRFCRVMNIEKFGEQFYMAGLLHLSGELSFLSSSLLNRTSYLETVNDDDPNKALKAITGLSNNQLTYALLSEWEVKGLARDLHADNPKSSKELTLLKSILEIPRALYKGGGSAEMRRITEQIVSKYKIDSKVLLKEIASGLNEAFKTASAIGLKPIADALPSGKPPQQAKIKVLTAEAAEQRAMTLLAELIEWANRPLDLGELFKLAAEGIYQVTGVDKSSFIVINSQTSIPEAQYTYGAEETGWKFDIYNADHVQENKMIIAMVIKRGEPLWLQEGGEWEALRIGTLKDLLPKGDCLMASLMIRDRIVGFAYSDGNGKKLTMPVFLRFKLIVNQVNMVLAAAAAKQSKKM